MRNVLSVSTAGSRRLLLPSGSFMVGVMQIPGAKENSGNIEAFLRFAIC